MVVLGCNIHGQHGGLHRGGELALLCKDLPPPAPRTWTCLQGTTALRVWNSNMIMAVPTQDITVAAAPLSLAVQVDLDPAARDGCRLA